MSAFDDHDLDIDVDLRDYASDFDMPIFDHPPATPKGRKRRCFDKTPERLPRYLRPIESDADGALRSVSMQNFKTVNMQRICKDIADHIGHRVTPKKVLDDLIVSIRTSSTGGNPDDDIDQAAYACFDFLNFFRKARENVDLIDGTDWVDHVIWQVWGPVLEVEHPRLFRRLAQVCSRDSKSQQLAEACAASQHDNCSPQSKGGRTAWLENSDIPQALVDQLAKFIVENQAFCAELYGRKASGGTVSKIVDGFYGSVEDADQSHKQKLQRIGVSAMRDVGALGAQSLLSEEDVRQLEELVQASACDQNDVPMICEKAFVTWSEHGEMAKEVQRKCEQHPRLHEWLRLHGRLAMRVVWVWVRKHMRSRAKLPQLPEKKLESFAVVANLYSDGFLEQIAQSQELGSLCSDAFEALKGML